MGACGWERSVLRDVLGRAGVGSGESLLSLRAHFVGCAVGFWLHVLVCREVSEERH